MAVTEVQCLSLNHIFLFRNESRQRGASRARPEASWSVSMEADGRLFGGKPQQPQQSLRKTGSKIVPTVGLSRTTMKQLICLSHLLLKCKCTEGGGGLTGAVKH